jgi:hypothetical protein
VTLQVDHAHSAVREPVYTRVVDEKQLNIWPSQKDFDRIYSFVSSEDYKVIAYVDRLLKDAEERCGVEALAALRSQFEKDQKKIKEAEAKKDKNALFEGERTELPT